MFYDERINAECGKIYKRGILYATLVTCLYTILRSAPLILEDKFAFRFFTTEFFMIICGIVILLYGMIHFYGTQDERNEFEKQNFYLQAGKIFLIIALTGYAFAIPFSEDRFRNDVPANHIILILEFLGFLYFIYAFKSRQISFNFSFIEKEKKEYYRHVWGNIGKLSGILAFPFGFAVFLDVLIHDSFVSFLAILLAYIVSVLGLGFEYLILSWIEKRSYEDESENVIDRGAFVMCVFTFVIYMLHQLIRVSYVGVASITPPIVDNLGRFMASMSNLLLYISYFCTITLFAVKSYIMARVASKLVKKAVRISLICGIANILLSFVYTFVYHFMSVAFPVDTEYSWMMAVSSINRFLVYGIMAVEVFAAILFVFGLKKDVGIAKIVVLLPIFKAVWSLVEAILEANGTFRLTAVILDGFVILGYYIAYYCIIKKHDLNT